MAEQQLDSATPVGWVKLDNAERERVQNWAHLYNAMCGGTETWQDRIAMRNFHKFPILCDLDGVIWLAHQGIAGSAEAVERFRQAGHRVLFVTNNSWSTQEEQVAALADVGINAAGDIVTSAMAGASLVQAGQRVLVCGGPGIEQALQSVGADIVRYADCLASENDEILHGIDIVMVGFHRWFDYEVMRRASLAISRGALLIGTNDDATYPTPSGPIPGGGSILAAIATASGVQPTIAGKPHQAMADVVTYLLGSVEQSAIMVGDRPSTDGQFAHTLGCRFALVRSGVTLASMSAATDSEFFAGVTLDFDVADLSAVADEVL